MTYYDLNMNSKRITSVQDPVSAQDVATKNYIDSILSGYMKQVKVQEYATAGTYTFTPPTGTTYAIAHLTAGGGGIGSGSGNAGGNGGNSSIAFASGTITATGGAGTTAFNGFSNANDGKGIAGEDTKGTGALYCGGQEFNYAGNPNSYYTYGSFKAQDGQQRVAGAAVTAGVGITVVVGAGGTAGVTSPAGRGQAGGSGYVWIEYY